MDNPNPRKTKRPKKGEPKPIPPRPPNWDRCHAYLKEKHRYCRQMPNANSFYCGNHQERDGNQVPKDSSGNIRKRIPCPIDKSHSIWEDQVEKHIQICPTARLVKQLEDQPYHQKGCNVGGHGSLCVGGGGSISTTTDKQLEWAKQLALRILAAHQQLFVVGCKKLTDSEISQLTLHDIEDSLPLKDYSGPELDAGLEEAIESYRIRSGGPKHLQQQASLLGHLRNVKGLATYNKNSQRNDNKNKETTAAHPKTVFLELGAGRGMAGLIAAGAFVASGIDDTSLIMIERASSRSKAETILRNHKSNLPESCLDVEGVQDWLRIHCDLADVHMPTVLQNFDEKSCHLQSPNTTDKGSTNDDARPSKAEHSHGKPNSNKVIIALAKHLCGVGTDLALKALYPVRDQLEACVLATCCHGVCDWKDYVGRDYLRNILTDDTTTNGSHNNNFGREEFELMRSWSSGTVVDDKCSNCRTAAQKNGQQKANNETGDEGTESDVLVEDAHTIPSTRNQRSPLGMKEIAGALNLSCGVQGLGRACQRLIDFGRREYIRHELFADSNNNASSKKGNNSLDDDGSSPCVDLFYYVPSSVTPQNAVLIGKRHSP